MKENKLEVSFFVQAKRTDKRGLVPIIGRISVGRTHSGFSTKCKTPLVLWDSRKQRLIGKSAMAVSVNQKLGECTALIHVRFHELSEREESFTATDVRGMPIRVKFTAKPCSWRVSGTISHRQRSA